MVLLTMTPLIAEAFQRSATDPNAGTDATVEEPSLDSPAAGKPISHNQIVNLWKTLKETGKEGNRLEDLLKGSRIYIPPPPPKPEPVSRRDPLRKFDVSTDLIRARQSAEYKALMARLRHEEEERKYERMVASTKMPSFIQQFPHSTNSVAHSFAEVNRPSTKHDLGDDDVTYNDVHRQVMLLINFMVTIIGCAVTLWILARWWNTPARLFLTMGGSAVVGIAEVGLYYGYLWHLGEAKKKDVKLKEVRQVLETWVVNKENESTIKKVDIGDRDGDGTGVRLRRTGTKGNQVI